MNMESVVTINSKMIENIKSRIYEIRGVKVMLDFDLAKLYGVETKRLKESVRRNIERFLGDDFMFELTLEECNFLKISSRSQFATLNKKGNNIKYAPLVFTELGVAMLSSVLRSSIAIEVNRNIMRAFVATRQMLYTQDVNNTRIGKLESDMQSLKEYIEDVFTDYNDINEDTRMQLELINMTLAELQTKIKEKKSESQPQARNPIGFKK